ncbi:MAG: alpha-glucosidase, partial [Spirochaetaceae bacterium]
WRNLELREAMYDVMRFWLDLGADGFRLDVVNWFVKDDEFRSNPWSMIMSPDLFQDHIYDRNRPETHDICRRMRSLTDGYTADQRHKPAEERVLVGEVFTKNAQLAAEFHGYNNDQLHMAFNFDFLYQPWSARAFYQSIMRWYEAIPAGAWPNFTLSNHDQPRHYGRYKKPLFTEARARVAAAMLLTLKGTPFLYYGEEIGMDNLPIRRSDLQDPFGKKTWPIRKFGRDPERTPMQWDSSPYAGFTEHGHRPWLPIPRDSVRKNVAVQLAEPESLLNFYRRLIALRKEYPVLQIGEITFLVPGTRNLLAYRRELPQNDTTRSVAVFLNFGMRKVLDFQRHIIQAEHQRFAERSWTVLLGTHRSAGDSVGLPTLQACEVLLLIADQ